MFFSSTHILLSLKLIFSTYCAIFLKSRYRDIVKACSRGNLCRTLSSHLKSLRDIALKEDTMHWNPMTIADPNGQLSAVEKVVTLVNGCKVLNWIKGFTVMLQESSVDITRAMGLVEDTRKSLQDVHHRVGEFPAGWMNSHAKWWKKLEPIFPWSRACASNAHGKHQSCYTWWILLPNRYNSTSRPPVVVDQ